MEKTKRITSSFMKAKDLSEEMDISLTQARKIFKKIIRRYNIDLGRCPTRHMIPTSYIEKFFDQENFDLPA